MKRRGVVIYLSFIAFLLTTFWKILLRGSLSTPMCGTMNSMNDDHKNWAINVRRKNSNLDSRQKLYQAHKCVRRNHRKNHCLYFLLIKKINKSSLREVMHILCSLPSICLTFKNIERIFLTLKFKNVLFFSLILIGFDLKTFNFALKYLNKC